MNRTDAAAYPAAVYIPVCNADNMLANKEISKIILETSE